MKINEVTKTHKQALTEELAVNNNTSVAAEMLAEMVLTANEDDANSTWEEQNVEDHINELQEMIEQCRAL